MCFANSLASQGLVWILAWSLLSVGPLGCTPRVIRAQQSPLVTSTSPGTASGSRDLAATPTSAADTAPTGHHGTGTAQDSPEPGKVSTSSGGIVPGADAVMQDAMVHAIMALDAYIAGDLPTTGEELETALNTMLAADLPQGEAGLTLLGQNLPPGYEGPNLVEIYRESRGRGQSVEIPATAEKVALEAEGGIGGPQGVGQASSLEDEGKGLPGHKTGEALDAPAQAPEEAAVSQEAPIDTRYLPADKMTYVRREIERIVAAFGDKNYPHSGVFEQQVAYFIQLYETELHGFFERSLLRSRKHIDMVKAVLREKGVPDPMAYIAFVESGFRSSARSSAGAVGLWQFMPRTARAYGLQVDRKVDERLDPAKATVAAREYFLDLVAIFGSSSFLLAMASYNAGEGKVQYCLKKVDDPFTQRTFWDIRSCLRKETREYIPRIIAAAIVAGAPDRFGFEEVLPFFDPSQYQLVTVPFSTSLGLLSTLAGTNVEELKAINLDLSAKSSSTPRHVSNYRLLVPTDRVGSIEAELAIIAARKGIPITPKNAVSVAQADPEEDKVLAAAHSSPAPVSTARKANAQTSSPKHGQNSNTQTANTRTASSQNPAKQRAATSSHSQHTESGARSSEKVASSRTTVVSSQEKSAAHTRKTTGGTTGTSSHTGREGAARGAGKDATKQKKHHSAQVASNPSGRTRYIKYKVQSGNTLHQIAADFGASEAKLRRWNPYLSGREVAHGDVVFVYELDWSYQKHAHRVVSGDTLSGLSARYGASLSELRRWNDLPGDLLRIGQGLVIYTHGTGSQASMQTASAPIRKKTPKKKAVLFEVQKGHNLSLIAGMFDVSIRELMAWNRLKNGRIYAGQKLKVYPGEGVEEVRHKVKSGDSLSTLAHRYHTNAASIRALNGLGSSNLIRQGQVLVVYRKVN